MNIPIPLSSRQLARKLYPDASEEQLREILSNTAGTELVRQARDKGIIAGVGSAIERAMPAAVKGAAEKLAIAVGKKGGCGCGARALALDQFGKK